MKPELRDASPELKDAYRTMAADEQRYYVVEHGASVVAAMDGGAFVAVTLPDEPLEGRKLWVYVGAIHEPATDQQVDGH